MAGKIVADTLEHSTAGSIATNYVVEGSAKSWVNFNGTGTVAVQDSLNVSSITDNGTATYTQNYSSSFSNASYSVTGCLRYTGTGTGLSLTFTNTSTPLTTSGTQFYANSDASVSVVDNPIVCSQTTGDLA